MTQGSWHWLANEHARVAQRSIEAGERITAALAGNPAPVTFPTSNRLADQLALVARLISARGSLGTKRQVFFVSLGGFDTHDSQLGAHATLMTSFAKFGEMIGATGLLGVALPMLVIVAAAVGFALAANLARRDPERFARLGRGR